MGGMKRKMALRKSWAETTVDTLRGEGYRFSGTGRPVVLHPMANSPSLRNFFRYRAYLFDPWVAGCPLSSSILNALSIRDLLGLNRLINNINEDTLRRALSRIDEASGVALDARASHERVATTADSSASGQP